MTYPEDLRQVVDDALAGMAPGTSGPADGLAEAMNYSLLAGGKRVRPVLCLATARTIGQRVDDFLQAAVAIEMVHTYSLVHDDLPAMDDDAMRRGKPTAHVAFGEAVAILAGDALFAEAVQRIAASPFGSEAVLGATRLLAAAAGIEGMVGGQYVDISGRDLDGDDLRRLHSLKTGRLITASVEIPLVLAGTPDVGEGPFLEFADELGILFQIVDDILDVTGAEEATGKPTGSDEKLGKVTYATLYGLDGARELASESHRRAVDALAGVGPEAESLVAVADYIYARES